MSKNKNNQVVVNFDEQARKVMERAVSTIREVDALPKKGFIGTSIVVDPILNDIHFNKELSKEEMIKLLSTIKGCTIDDGDFAGFGLFRINRDLPINIDNSLFIALQSTEGINVGIEDEKVYMLVSNAGYLWASFSTTSGEHIKEGWYDDNINSIKEVIKANNGLDAIKVEDLPLEEQEIYKEAFKNYKENSELIKSVISSTPIEEVNEIEDDRIYKLKTINEGKEVGEVVPNTGTIENLYFNTNLPTEEVLSKVKELTYDGEDTPLYVICGAKDLSIIYIITRLDEQINEEPTYVFTTITQEGFNEDIIWLSKETSGLPGKKAGWQPKAYSPFVLNKEIINTLSGHPGGAENDKLTDIVAVSPFVKEPNTTSYSYHRYINNNWVEVISGENGGGDIELKEISLDLRNEQVNHRTINFEIDKQLYNVINDPKNKIFKFNIELPSLSGMNECSLSIVYPKTLETFNFFSNHYEINEFIFALNYAGYYGTYAYCLSFSKVTIEEENKPTQIAYGGSIVCQPIPEGLKATNNSVSLFTGPINDEPDVFGSVGFNTINGINVCIDTNQPEIITDIKTDVLTSPNGSKFKIKVDDSGVVSTEPFNG